MLHPLPCTLCEALLYDLVQRRTCHIRSTVIKVTQLRKTASNNKFERTNLKLYITYVSKSVARKNPQQFVAYIKIPVRIYKLTKRMQHESSFNTKEAV